MGMRWMMGVVGMGVALLLVTPSAMAADESTAEAAQLEAPQFQPDVTHPTREQILQAIEDTRQTDPELAAEMENQLELLESGELNLGAEGGVPGGTTQENIAGGLPGGGLVGPPVDGDLNQQGNYLPPEVRAQLEQLFQEKGTGDPSKDAAVRAEAEQILREHGIEPPNWEHEGDWEHEEGQWQGDHGEGFERAYFEQMSPEAREQMEQFFSEHEASEQPTMDRETFEREYSTFEAPTHEYEAVTHEYEAPTHEYEAPEFEQYEYEPPEYDYQPPQQP